ncbi:unnamed protein product [Rotaria socialis]|uniref:Uncharacterized protein n=1 Tax=Rotaria socialis TaxID=392032 RepID=A0A820UUB8_9BILA|nr:unnamed protein product [Rotaria socialis]CAF3372738.1 unnamed protein product [Rotaria socialis]CAF3738469.1 unnamed protein product [Rotaria socialis]CAF3746614.1 unnamed protein product [Rotaria socialis]CAF4456671.1 unnamed protein product [Rotaria socialis]
MILEPAKRRIDDLNEKANRLKLDVLREAQAQNNAKIKSITEQAVILSAEDANRLLTSTSTIVITTNAKTTSITQVAGTTAVVDNLFPRLT